MDSRQKYQLMFPQKCFEKKLKFDYTKQSYPYFKTPVGQEADKYDEELKKAFTKSERGVSFKKIKTQTQEGTKVASIQIVKKEVKPWNPNDFAPKVLREEKPLLDNTGTPRSTLKKITLERNFDHDIWLYNKSNLDEFSAAAKDAKKGALQEKDHADETSQKPKHWKWKWHSNVVLIYFQSER